MAITKQGDSTYSRKLTQRRGMGPEHRSLGNEKYGPVFLPLPRPFHFDHIPGYVPKINAHEWRFNGLLSCENLSQIRRFQNPNHVYKRPKIREQVKTTRYNHYEMNYSGWNV